MGWPLSHKPVSARCRTGWGWHVLAAVVLAGMFISLVGCTTTIIPPKQVQQPVTVLLLDHGHTPSLVLPADPAQRQVVRYAYGDWRYYAKAQRGSASAIRALFWPTTGALGRRVMPGPMQVDHVLDVVAVGSQQVHVIVVDWTRVEALLASLEAAMHQRQADAVVNPLADLVFVPYARPYSVCHNSNQAVAGWLESLDCQVRGPAVFSRWRVAEHP